ncbi:MAG: hypothetical protein WAP47_18840 [Candidatus Rokuibacteriota bacterium]
MPMAESALPFELVRSAFEPPLYPLLVNIAYQSGPQIIVLTFDRPLAGAYQGGTGGFTVKRLGAPLSVDHSEIIDEEYTCQIHMNGLGLTPDQLLYSGANPTIQPFIGGPSAPAFDHPVPWS